MTDRTITVVCHENLKQNLGLVQVGVLLLWSYYKLYVLLLFT